MNIYEFLEDFDNPELEGYDWEEQMEYAVQQYNYDYDESYDSRATIKNYKSWKRDKYTADV